MSEKEENIMINLKKEIAMILPKFVELPVEELENYIEIPKDSAMGDYAFPCFRLAKQMQKAPQVIAQELKEKMELDNISEIIEKINVAGGYLNFVINKQIIIKFV